MVTGSAGAVGGELTSNPLVRKLSFTGSTEIGRQLMEQCAKDIKSLPSWAATRRLSSLTMPTSIKPSRGAGVEVPQRRADLRLRQPPVRP